MSRRAPFAGVVVAAVAAALGLGLAATHAAGQGAKAAGDAKAGQKIFQSQCALCHAAAGGVGPSLQGVVGRKAASTAFPNYSDALKRSGLVWTPDKLDAYLADPQALVPGTLMQVQVESAASRAEVIAYLETLRAPAPAASPTPGAGAAAEVAGGGDWREDAPGKRHRISAADLPPPGATKVGVAPPRIVQAPHILHVPAGLQIAPFAEDLAHPRLMRTAPNGDVFVAESAAGRIRVLRPAADGSKAAATSTYAEGLKGVFGIAFYPPQDPKWVYAAETNRVVRFPYVAGDLKARGEAQVIVPELAPTSGGHVTRDIAFSLDGQRMLVSVGSGSNVAEGMDKKPLAEAEAYDGAHGLGAAWGSEERRADVLAFTPEGGPGQVYAAGIRNCVGLVVHPRSGDAWCSVNERDLLGDNLVPDYVTRVKPGAFYGWPWWYIGDHEDPRRAGERPDLKGKVTAPDVLLQSHSAPIQMTFYGGRMFPAWRGSALVALHGSWNRTARTGYKLIRVPVNAAGAPEGDYEDLVTGWVVDERSVWGRPAGVTELKDGSILISDDGAGIVWRLSKK